MKARLRAATDAALEAGVFAVPSSVVDEEMFCGRTACNTWRIGSRIGTPWTQGSSLGLDLPVGASRR